MSEHDDRTTQPEAQTEPHTEPGGRHRLRGQEAPEGSRERAARESTARESTARESTGSEDSVPPQSRPLPPPSAGSQPPAHGDAVDDDTLVLPDWREPPTGEVPQFLEELSGVPARDLGGPRTGELPTVDDETVPWSLPPSAQRERPERDDDTRSSAEQGGSAEPQHERRGRDRGHDDESPLRRSSVKRRPAATGSRRRGSEARGASSDEGSHVAPTRSKALSTVTGVALAAVVVAALLLGRIPLLVVVALALELAASEAFSVLHRGGLVEARFIGLAGVGALIGVAYAFGPAADDGVVAAVFVLGAAWYVLGPLRRPAYEGLSHTFGVVAWVGLLGSFAAALLRPATFLGHGELVLVVAIATTVADDTVAFFVGSLLGRHRLAPRISPNKTVEGLIGGSVAAIVVGALLGIIAPLTVVDGALLGLVVAVVAPLGDLLESAFKRQFHVKDSGALLPGHGGVLDRIDAMLFVLPASYYLFTVIHLR